MKEKLIEILGIDLGNTLIYERKPRPDAYRVVRRLIDQRFGDNVHIVSRVDKKQEIRAREFVTGFDFQTYLGIPIERVHFCRERHEKGAICERLGITHFIDDRPEVMAHMPLNVTNKILFDPSPDDLEKFHGETVGLPIVRTWVDIERLLLGMES